MGFVDTLLGTPVHRLVSPEESWEPQSPLLAEVRGTCVSDSASESWDCGMSGFGANDWLGTVEGQTLQMFERDFQVMSVSVTLLVDVRMHQCPPHSSFLFQGRALSLPQQPLYLH